MGTTLKKMMHNRAKLSQFDQLFILGKPWGFPHVLGIKYPGEYIYIYIYVIWQMDMIWYDMIWYDLIWLYDMIWYDMIYAKCFCLDACSCYVSVIVFAFWLTSVSVDDLLRSSSSLHMYKNISEPLRPSWKILRLWGHRERARNHIFVALPYESDHRLQVALDPASYGIVQRWWSHQYPRHVKQSSCMDLYGMIGRQYSILETTNSPTRLPDVTRFSKNMFPLLKFLSSSARCKWNSAHSISLNGLKWSTSLWIDPYPDPKKSGSRLKEFSG